LAGLSEYCHRGSRPAAYNRRLARPGLHLLPVRASGTLRSGKAGKYGIRIGEAGVSQRVQRIRRNSLLDGGARAFALVGGSLPIFFVGLLVLSLFYSRLRWLPGPGRLDAVLRPPPRFTGMYTIDSLLAGNWPLFKNSFQHLILPAITLGYFSTAVLLRMTRSAMLEVLNQDYVRTARAKGVSENRVMWVHVLRNASIPIITNLMAGLPSLLLGAFLIERFFSIPGIGREVILAVERSDFPVIKALTVYVAFATMASNLLADLMYKAADPRVSGVSSASYGDGVSRMAVASSDASPDSRRPPGSATWPLHGSPA
jgi:ABC-type antimicrobial peptide transport system permease subunit